MKKFTPYQLKYLSWLITHKRSVSDDERYTGVLAEAQVDLNPHQVDAALFAFHSPLSNGAILADEVGLGKTIEAGIVLSQAWAENHRHILIICPASLRKQWDAELYEKFFLKSRIIERKSYDTIVEKHHCNPFNDAHRIIICSYQFAARMMDYIHSVKWDMVIFDEAHKLRNVYKKENKISHTLKDGLKGVKKLLLTATPLQNDVKELYGLVSMIDDDYFGDLDNFTTQYGAFALRRNKTYNDLRERLRPIVHRTLRKDVQEYVRYTERHPMLQQYTPSENEEKLRLLVEEYLRRDDSYGIPNSQRSLITLVLQKLLCSSTFAIAGTLQTIITRLEEMVKSARGMENGISAEVDSKIEEDLSADYEAMGEYEEEEDDGEDEQTIRNEDKADSTVNSDGISVIKTVETPSKDKVNKKRISPEAIPQVEEEIEQLRAMHELAMGIASNKKGECLLKALSIAFKEKEKKGEPEKALIFTESTRTQKYVKQLLEENGYEGKLVLFNGTNSDPTCKQIYQSWKQRNEGTNKISGSLTADKRQALVDYFRDEAQIMIATEAAAEGINLQFCSLIVNYDMPWNPQRVEQRIGRCHRYGQKYDVIVVNFINTANRADERIYQLLRNKFKLFDGVFGSSDEVLGCIGDGVDFEKRIMKICQQCRTPKEIDSAFDRLQEEMSEQIAATVAETRRDLFQNFDEDVVHKLKVRREETKEQLDEFQKALWNITIDMLGDDLDIIDSDRHIFQLKHAPSQDIHVGKYSIGLTADGTYNYRVGIPLAQWVIREADKAVCPDNLLYEVDNSGYEAKITRLDNMQGHRGVIIANELEFSSPRDNQQRIVLTGIDTTTGEILDEEVIKKIMEPAVSHCMNTAQYADADGKLSKAVEESRKSIVERVHAKNADFIRQEEERINRWADDQNEYLEKQINDVKRQVREKQNEARKEEDPARHIELEKELKVLEKKKRRLRAELDAHEDDIDDERNKLIDECSASMKENVTETELFTFQWIIK